MDASQSQGTAIPVVGIGSEHVPTQIARAASSTGPWGFGLRAYLEEARIWGYLPARDTTPKALGVSQGQVQFQEP